MDIEFHCWPFNALFHILPAPFLFSCFSTPIERIKLRPTFHLRYADEWPFKESIITFVGNWMVQSLLSLFPRLFQKILSDFINPINSNQYGSQREEASVRSAWLCCQRVSGSGHCSVMRGSPWIVPSRNKLCHKGELHL